MSTSEKRNGAGALTPVIADSPMDTNETGSSNGKPVTPKTVGVTMVQPPAPILVQPAVLSKGLEDVKVDTVPEFLDEQGRLPPVQLSYKNLKFSIDIKHAKGVIETREILKGCDGVFNSGRLTAVMGASGAGKTSLMNLVSGNPTATGTEKISGEIRLNGQNVFNEMARIRELSAYIQQDDILMGTMTVREAVTLSARLRLPKSMPDEEKLRRVEHTVEMLGLTKCLDTLIGDNFNKGVSGGEKRRVSMALELIKSPSILFLDEPTSGLDTFTAHSIIALLRDIAHTQGKTIVCTIHQPSSDIFHMFDDLLLLADGQVMYHGEAEHVVEYFNQRNLVCPENFNPADHLFMKVLYSMDAQLQMISDDLESSAPGKGASVEDKVARDAHQKALYDAEQEKEKVRVGELLKEWLASDENKTMLAQLASPLTSPLPDPSVMRAERPGQLYAFELLAKRRWHDLLRDRMKVRMQGGQYIFFSILLGLIFLHMSHSQNSVQNREGCLFFVTVQALFMSFMSNLNTFGPEKRVMMREMESGMYGVAPYFFSRWIVEIPFRCVFPFIYSIILYWMIGFQNTGEHFILFAITLMLVDNCGTNMAVMICSVFPDVQQAMQAGPAFLLPLMVFSGFYVNLGSLGWWFRWMSYISPVRYGFSSVIQNELSGMTFECDPVSLSRCIQTGEDALRLLSLDNDPSIGLNLVILLILLFGFLMGAFWFIYRTTRKK